MSASRSRILAYHRLLQLARQLNVALVMTVDPLKVDEGQTVAEVRALLEANAFDQAPVTRAGRDVGLLRCEHLTGTDPEALVGSLPYEALSLANSVEPSTPMLRLLIKLAERPSCVVLDEIDQVIGLVHFSDLNRQAVRTFLYLWHTAVEMALAALIDQRYPDASWMERTSQACTLKKHWAKLRRIVQMRCRPR